MDFGETALVEKAAADAGLIRDHDQPESGLPKRAKRRPGAGKQGNVLRIGKISALFDDGTVAIENNEFFFAKTKEITGAVKIFRRTDVDETAGSPPAVKAAANPLGKN